MLADGVDASFLRSDVREPNPDPIFLWAGRLMPLKAAPLAVRAFARVREQLPTARLLIAGHGPEQDAVAALVTALGLDGSVELLGPRPWPEVRELMDAADCFVFSSLRDSFGGQCLEAAARGLPLAVFNHHGAGELLPDAADPQGSGRRPRPCRRAGRGDARGGGRPGALACHEPGRRRVGGPADLGARRPARSRRSTPECAVASTRRGPPARGTTRRSRGCRRRGRSRLPAEGLQPADVEQLARGAVGLGGVPHEVARVADDPAISLGQLADRSGPHPTPTLIGAGSS